MAKAESRVTFYACSNCGFSSPRRNEFTYHWCDHCATAGIKVFVITVAVALAAFFVVGIVEIVRRG